jgi:hypothetical protein
MQSRKNIILRENAWEDYYEMSMVNMIENKIRKQMSS